MDKQSPMTTAEIADLRQQVMTELSARIHLDPWQTIVDIILPALEDSAPFVKAVSKEQRVATYHAFLDALDLTDDDVNQTEEEPKP